MIISSTASFAEAAAKSSAVPGIFGPDTLKLFLSLSLVRKAGKYSANPTKREVRRENTFAINVETSRSTILLNDFFCTTMLTHGWMEVRSNTEFRIVERQFLLGFIRSHRRLRVKLFKPSNLLPTLLHLRQLRTIQLPSAIPTGDTPLAFFFLLRFLLRNLKIIGRSHHRSPQQLDSQQT